MTTRRRFDGALVVAATISVAALTGCASGPHTGFDPEPPDVIEIDPADALTGAELEALGAHGDAMPGELSDLATVVTSRYQASPGFSGFEWVRERHVLRLWWFGEVPVELAELLAPHGSAVVVEPTVNPPQELAAAVRRVTVPGAVPGVFVSVAGSSIDCSHLDVMAEPEDPSLDEARIAEAIEAVAGFPVELEIGSVMLISETAPMRGSSAALASY